MLGDTLLRIQNQAIQDVDDLRHALRPLYAGHNANLLILRGGELREMSVTLGTEG